jgi:hypothetical protein
MNEETDYFRRSPTALSLPVLERAIGKKETEKLVKQYIAERNRNVKIKGIYCHKCGTKIDFKRNIKNKPYVHHKQR